MCPTLCNPMDYSPSGSSVHGILQARILEWVAMPSPRRSARPRGRTCVSYISCDGRQVLYHWRHLELTYIFLILQKIETNSIIFVYLSTSSSF